MVSGNRCYRHVDFGFDSDYIITWTSGECHQKLVGSLYSYISNPWIILNGDGAWVYLYCLIYCFFKHCINYGEYF